MTSKKTEYRVLYRIPGAREGGVWATFTEEADAWAFWHAAGGDNVVETLGIEEAVSVRTMLREEDDE